jgi:hypothetical protein
MGRLGLCDYPASEVRREPVQIAPQPIMERHFGPRPQVRIRRDAERQRPHPSNSGSFAISTSQ